MSTLKRITMVVLVGFLLKEFILALSVVLSTNRFGARYSRMVLSDGGIQNGRRILSLLMPSGSVLALRVRDIQFAATIIRLLFSLHHFDGMLGWTCGVFAFNTAVVHSD